MSTPARAGAVASEADAATISPSAPWSSWYALAILTVVTLFSFVDRGVLILQAEVIRKAFSLSDLQLGFLQGTGVAIFAALAAYPMAWLADRFDRRKVLAGSVIFWSAAVIASGMAQSFEQLALASALVGAGEAGLVPIVYALIPDLFPEKRRQTANSIYAVASTVTGGLAYALNGQVIGSIELIRGGLPDAMQTMDAWRLAMFVVAAPAPIMVMLIATIMIRRRERTSEGAVASAPAPAGVAVPVEPFMPYLKQHWQTFALYFGGMGVGLLGYQAGGSWLGVIYLRVYGQTPQQVGAVLGGIGLGATAIGFALSIWLVRRFGPTMGPRLNLRVMVLTVLMLAFSFGAMPFATRVEHMYGIQAFYITLITTSTMLLPTIVQTLAPGHLRARVASIQGVVGAVAAATAPLLTGLISDQFKQMPNGLTVAAALVAVPCLTLSAVLFFLCERRYEATALVARRIDEATAA